MYWQKRFDRKDPDEGLLQMMQAVRETHKDYGYRRIHGELRKQGLKVNKKRVQRIVQSYGMQVTSYTRKSRRFSTYKGTVGGIAPNRVNRRFSTCIPHQKITTDTTEFKYYEPDAKGRVSIRKLYLDPFMDMWNLEILSYGISDKPSAQSIMTALNEAIEETSDCRYRRTFHSDRGWAYQMGAYRQKLKDAGLDIFSRRRNQEAFPEPRRKNLLHRRRWLNRLRFWKRNWEENCSTARQKVFR